MAFNSGQTLQGAAIEQRISALETAPPGKMVAYASRSTDTIAAAAETGILRVDGVRMVAGHRYGTSIAFNFYCNVTGDFVAARLRYSTAGPAGTASTMFGSSPQTPANNFTVNAIAVSGTFLAPSTGTFSVLLSVTKGTGSGTVRSAGFVELPFFDYGADPTGFTAVVV